jgi:opacity protein-like surface antigen
MRIRPLAALLTVALLFGAAATAAAQDRWRIDLENGAAISGYNDVRIPGDSGTKFSMTGDLASDTEYFWRLRADVRVAPKHVLSGLIAPLTISSSGTFDAPVDFAGATFAPGVPTDGTWTFNSYRVTYRYEPFRRDTWMFGIGVSVKVRDAVIRLESAGTAAEKTDLGVVPLVNFKFERRLGGSAALLIEGDALAAPQGRAEDIFAGIVVDAGKQWSIKAGYRFLEGGADNDEVYTFAAVHYVAAGVVFRF